MLQDGYKAQMQKALELAGQLAETPGPHALLVIDLDRFYRVTARFGENGGEMLVDAAGIRIRDLLAGDCQMFARIGGDRFAALLAGANDDSALVTAERIHKSLQRAFTVADESIFISASIGVATAQTHRDAARLLHELSTWDGWVYVGAAALTLVYRPGMDNVPAFQLLRERDVRLAVERDEFIVHFQPVVDAARGELRAFEALLRWVNPEEGLLPPSMFIDVLRETGLIEIVGRRVLGDACEHASRWFNLSGVLVPVHVNIVPDQLYSRGFVAFIQELLLTMDLPGEGLILELTEDALIEDVDGAAATLRALAELGVRVMIDDFGSGYSSLSYLHDLPVAGLKLDRGFFGAIPNSGKQQEIVRSIIALAHALGLTVVAEGIETQEQWTAVRGLDCDFIQGFHFARPLDAEQATRYLTRELTRGKAA